jgi:hypothetical protein
VFPCMESGVASVVIEHAAAYLGVDTVALCRLIQSGLLKIYTKGGTYSRCFKEADLDNLKDVVPWL